MTSLNALESRSWTADSSCGSSVKDEFPVKTHFCFPRLGHETLWSPQFWQDTSSFRHQKALHLLTLRVLGFCARFRSADLVTHCHCLRVLSLLTWLSFRSGKELEFGHPTTVGDSGEEASLLWLWCWSSFFSVAMVLVLLPSPHPVLCSFEGGLFLVPSSSNI